jgi:hypothetical protein
MECSILVICKKLLLSVNCSRPVRAALYSAPCEKLAIDASAINRPLHGTKRVRRVRKTDGLT